MSSVSMPNTYPFYSEHRALPILNSIATDPKVRASHSEQTLPLSPPYSSSSEGFMKRQRTSPSPSPSRMIKRGRESETSDLPEAARSPPESSHTPISLAPVIPATQTSRISINNLISAEPAPRPSSGEAPLTYLAHDDPCVRQPFEVYLTYASALPRRREELDEIEKTLEEAVSLIRDHSSELDKAENAKPRRARIIGPLRTRLHSAETQRVHAMERVETARTRVAFSEKTMSAMQSVLLKFGWRIAHVDGEASLQPHPNHPAARAR